MKRFKIIGSVQSFFSKHWRAITLVILSTFALLLFAPSSREYQQYQFSKGKPWQYSLLTAPYDFPIYKTDEALEQEREAIRAKFKPVYRQDDLLGGQVLQELRQAGREQHTPASVLRFLESQLQRLYTQGLVSGEDLNRLQAQENLEVSLMRSGNVLETTPRTRFLSLKEAYDQILESASKEHIETSPISRLGLNHYLRANVRFEPEYNEKMLNEALSAISLSSGLVQQGQRIIDKGELVSPEIYNILNSYLREEAIRTGSDELLLSLRRLGGLLYTLLIFTIFMLYLHRLPSVIARHRNLIFISILILIFTITTELNASYDWFTLDVVPYIMIILLVRTFFDSHAALLTYLATLLLCIPYVPNILEFISLQLSAGLVALIVLRDLRNREKLNSVAFIVFLAYVLLSFALLLFQGGEISVRYSVRIFYFAINLALLASSSMVVGALERLFGYMSHLTLIELDDTKNPLLQELSELAPGSFQHSHSVAMLCGEAAIRVGANHRLVRVGALYHDIGKMKNPAYFTENQCEGMQYNPHRWLSPVESAQIIIRHVTDGIAIAQKHGLPQPIIDFIRTHHGRSLVKYFYITESNNHPDTEVDKAVFTYPGPNPSTKEQGILMLADIVEASSRSLPEYTEEIIRNHINRMVESVLSEGLLNDTPLTFKDITEIKEVFFAKIKTMYHARIAYPELRK